MLERKTVENDIYNLSKAFAIRIVNLYKFLVNERHEYVMSKQLFRSEQALVQMPLKEKMLNQELISVQR